MRLDLADRSHSQRAGAGDGGKYRAKLNSLTQNGASTFDDRDGRAWHAGRDGATSKHNDGDTADLTAEELSGAMDAVLAEMVP